MQIANIKKAAMITGQPEIRLLYAVRDGILDHAVVNGTIILAPQEVLACRDSGNLRLVHQMIKRTLFRIGFWRSSWEDGWENPEPPMTMQDYIEWMKEKKSYMKDRSISFAEKTYWESLGVL